MVVRGTRAGHILIGIFVMVVLYAVALWAGLEALRSVLSFIVPYIGWRSSSYSSRRFAARWRGSGANGGWRGLPRAGIGQRDSARSGRAGPAEYRRVDRAGADIGLRTFIESGVPLEALLSRDLLLSIFNPASPCMTER